MIQTDRIVAHGVDCRRSPVTSATWQYLSLAPWPQLPQAGTPMASILEAGDLGMVQLSSQLDPPGFELEALRSLIQRQPTAAEPVRLQSAVGKVTQVTIIADPAGEARELAQATGSGYPPHTAVFSLSLRGDDLDRFRRAMAGERGLVELCYRAVVDDVTTDITADIADWFVRPSAERFTNPPAEGRPAGSTTVQEGEPC
jgi:hypothetical protein